MSLLHRSLLALALLLLVVMAPPVRHEAGVTLAQASGQSARPSNHEWTTPA